MRKRRLYRWLLPLVILTLLLSTAPTLAWSTPAAPSLIVRNASGNAGNWYAGAVPPNVDFSKPVLVFVPGLHSSAQTWFGQTTYSGTNDMYAYAYNNGYRTAFVNLGDSDGTGQSMWTNGSILAGTLAAITQYYHVTTVNIIAHSKGGIDSNAAVASYGAARYVGHIYTLSTPHWGSPLADLAYSWWGGWLADLLGQQDNGTYVLQTGYMKWFRSVTDGGAADANVRYFTEDGTDWGPTFSSLWYGGLYLSSWGSNDGAVPDSYATKPGATHVATLNLNHDSIHTGNGSWSTLSPYVGSVAGATPLLSRLATTSFEGLGMLGAAPAGRPADLTPHAAIMRGERFSGQATTTFPVESGVTDLKLGLLLSQGSQATLSDPTGKVVALQTVPGDNEVFRGAVARGVDVVQPVAGTWTLHVTGQTGAYLLLAQPTGGATVVIDLPTGVQQAGGRVSIAPRVSGHDGNKPVHLTMQVGRVTSRGVQWSTAAQQATDGPVALDGPAQDSIVSGSLAITGTMPDGTSFERDVVLSLPFAAHAGPEGLNQAGH